LLNVPFSATHILPGALGLKGAGGGGGVAAETHLQYDFGQNFFGWPGNTGWQFWGNGEGQIPSDDDAT
jgi:hypothetical protein